MLINKTNTPSFLHFIVLLICVLSSSLAHAFDASKVANGLYYNASNVETQLWSPFFFAQQGQLIDPYLFAQTNGVKALEGRGQTYMLKVITPFLYGGCHIDETKLRGTPGLITPVPTVFVDRFIGKNCGLKQEVFMDNYKPTTDRRSDNPFPTFYLNQDIRMTGPMWVYGVPGILSGQGLPVNAYPEAQLGARLWPVNGVVSRTTFVPLPVIEPDTNGIAYQDNGSLLKKYFIGLGEAAHRGSDITVSTQLLQSTTTMLKAQLFPLYYPRLERSITQDLGAIERSYFELGLIQGIDLDNQRSFDYAGMARIGAVTKTGLWRWVDVIYVWRKQDNSLSIVATSEAALYKPEHHFFSNKNPSLWSPSLTISGFSDFDKDKQLEIIANLSTPVAMAETIKGPLISIPIHLRQNFLYAWHDAKHRASGHNETNTNHNRIVNIKDTPAMPLKVGAAQTLTWQAVYQTVAHEERTMSEDPSNLQIQRYGQ